MKTNELCHTAAQSLLEERICWLDTNQGSRFAMQKYVLVPNTDTLAQYVGEKGVGESQCFETDLGEPAMS